jgi:hypothetical protein
MQPGNIHGRRLLALLPLFLFTLTGCPGLLTPSTTIQTARGEVKAILGGADEFPRFTVEENAIPLRDAGLDPTADLLIVRRGAEARALLVDEMAWHHVAEGTLDGQPFAVAYCVVCDSGMGITPIVDGRTLHVSAGGLSNGVVLARDDETGTFWSLFTGEALAGPLAGKQMEVWPIERTSVQAALKSEPDLAVVRSQISAFGRNWSRWVTHITRDDEGYMPFFFRRSLSPADERRGELDLGLGVVIDGEARFYPAAELAQMKDDAFEDSLGATTLAIQRSGDGRTWDARRSDGTRVFQVWGRWYGFAGTFPKCELFAATAPRGGALLPQPSLAAIAPSTER